MDKLESCLRLPRSRSKRPFVSTRAWNETRGILIIETYQMLDVEYLWGVEKAK